MAEQQGHGIVIGAGVSGLIAAIELEKAGWDVTIVDRHGTPGGRVCTRETHDFPLDEGFRCCSPPTHTSRRTFNSTNLTW